jgi:alkylated DNA repair dioxygenase AlkB
MTQLLLCDAAELHAVPIPGAEIFYQASMPLPGSAQSLLCNLITQVPWRAEEIVVWGKRRAQPRLVAWFGDEGHTYTYSGIRMEPLGWTDVLWAIRTRVQDAAQCEFNGVLLNYYRNQNDSMGLHSDDEPELGPTPVIASVSLGERRTLILKHKTRKDLKRVKLPLESGSLLLMRGDTQRNWRHGIDKEARPCGPRVNLTFRRIYPRGQKAGPAGSTRS